MKRSGERDANLSTAKNLERGMNLQVTLNPLCFMTLVSKRILLIIKQI